MWLMQICALGWMSDLTDIWMDCHHAVFVFVFILVIGLRHWVASLGCINDIIPLLCLDVGFVVAFMCAGWTAICGDTQSIRTDQ